MKTITFKSKPFYFRKEVLGLKRNTVRRFKENKQDIRQELLNDYISSDLNLLQITIINNVTLERFTRQVTDVTEFEGYYIISW